MMRHYLLVCGVVCTLFLALGCEAPDDGDLAVNEEEQALLNTICNQYSGAALSMGGFQNGTLTNTKDSSIQNEYIFKHSFSAKAGQTVTFTLLVPDASGGAWLALGQNLNSSCASTGYLAQAKSQDSGLVSLTYTFRTGGTYSVVVRQAAPVFPGAFIYDLAAASPEVTFDTVCATIGGTYDGRYDTPPSGKWTALAVQNYAIEDAAIAATWLPQWEHATLLPSTRTVLLGGCSSRQATNCGTAGPKVCEGDTFGYGPLANACTARNFILSLAFDYEGWSAYGGWQPITRSSLCYGM